MSLFSLGVLFLFLMDACKSLDQKSESNLQYENGKVAEAEDFPAVGMVGVHQPGYLWSLGYARDPLFNGVATLLCSNVVISAAHVRLEPQTMKKPSMEKFFFELGVRFNIAENWRSEIVETWYASTGKSYTYPDIALMLLERSYTDEMVYPFISEVDPQISASDDDYFLAVGFTGADVKHSAKFRYLGIGKGQRSLNFIPSYSEAKPTKPLHGDSGGPVLDRNELQRIYGVLSDGIDGHAVAHFESMAKNYDAISQKLKQWCKK